MSTMSDFEYKALWLWGVLMAMRCVMGIINRVVGV